MANPILDYSVTIIYGGQDLTVEGNHTPNITGIYGDYINSGATKVANCRVNIAYSNVQWTLNNDNSVTVTGNISSDSLVRSGVYPTYCGVDWQIWAEFDGDRTFSTVVAGESSGTYDLNLPASFSITVPPLSTSTAASIHYFNKAVGYNFDPDEFTVGLIVTNPNLPDYRPGKIYDGSTWKSHNRAAGFEKIYTSSSTTREMRTQNGGEGTGNPPTIYNAAWKNQRKIGSE